MQIKVPDCESQTQGEGAELFSKSICKQKPNPDNGLLLCRTTSGDATTSHTSRCAELACRQTLHTVSLPLSEL